jgi:glycosyltransferase involved in cell wall biosynthesis
MLSVIIPVYNERFTIRELLRRVCAVKIPKQLVIVDDFSKDGTRAILQGLEKDPSLLLKDYDQNRFRFVFQPYNQGKGAAIRTGIPLAEEPITLIQDADLEYDPADYFFLLKPLQDGLADVVYGSRFAGTCRRVHSFWHSLGNKVLTSLSNMFTDLSLTDMETCYKVFRTDVLQGIPIRSNRFGFEPEITAKIAKLGCRVFEVPINYYGRTYAQGKKIGWKDAFQALYIILKYWLVDDLYTSEAAGLRALRIMESAGKYNRWLFHQCEPFLGQRVLEMGSGVGNIVPFLLDKEQVFVTEVFPSYLQELQREFGRFFNVKVFPLDFNDPEAFQRLARAETVDTVLSVNVLEHIPDDDMALKGCFDILPEDGRLVLLVPAHQRLYCGMDEYLGHRRRYDRDPLRRQLQSAGFEVVHEQYLNTLGALGWFFNGRLLKRRLLPSRQLRLFDRLVRWLDMEKGLKPWFGLSLLMVGRKTTTRDEARNAR